jgi:hypothetical protein
VAPRSFPSLPFEWAHPIETCLKRCCRHNFGKVPCRQYAQGDIAPRLPRATMVIRVSHTSYAHGQMIRPWLSRSQHSRTRVRGFSCAQSGTTQQHAYAPPERSPFHFDGQPKNLRSSTAEWMTMQRLVGMRNIHLTIAVRLESGQIILRYFTLSTGANSSCSERRVGKTAEKGS